MATYEFLQPEEAGRLFVQQHVDNRLRGKHQIFVSAVLPCLAQDFAKDLVAYRLRCLERTAPLAYRAWMAQYVLERLARTLTCQLHQAERRHFGKIYFGPVTRRSEERRVGEAWRSRT